MVSASDRQRVVIVLGFHRSGTSMVTRMLNLLGVDLGDEIALLPPEERDNARGYWEPQWMIELNDEILTTLGGGAFAPFRLEPGWERSPQLEPLRERARALLEAHFATAQVWGWKDPRTSLTLPFWRELLDAPLSCVVCVRSPADAVASALKRGVTDIHRWTYAELWLQYTAYALSHTSPDERTLVFYEDILRDPVRETHRLAAALGLSAHAGIETAVESVDPELRHHVTSPWDVAVDPGLPLEARTLYLLLRARRELEPLAAEYAVDGPLEQALDRLATEQLDSYRATSDAEALHRQRAVDLECSETALAETVTRVATNEQEVARLRGEKDQLEGTLRELEGVLRGRDDAVAELNRILAERDAALGTMLASRSWRVTRPLRALRLRRGR